MFNLLFLGTSAHLPIPREGCNCPQCASPDPKDRRTRSSVLINLDTLIDCGPDVLQQLRRHRIKSNTIKNVILTHNHNDASGGIELLKAQNPNIEIYYPNDTSLYLNCHSKLDSESKKTLSGPQIKSGIPSIDLSPTINRLFIPHGNAKNVAMVIQMQLARHLRVGPPPAGGWDSSEAKEASASHLINIFYNPDTHNLGSAIETLKKVEVAILDGSGWQHTFPSHQPMVDIIRITKPLRNLKIIYFTHNGHTHLPHRQMVKLVRQYGDNRYDLAFDGLELSC